MGSEGGHTAFEVHKSESSPTESPRGRRRFGRDHYAKIGRKGGEALLENRGPEYFAEIGKKGGEAVKKKYGRDYYIENGRKGGKANRGPGK